MAVALHRTSLPLKEHPAIPIGSTQLVAEVPTPGDGQPFSYYRVPGAKSLFIFRPADRAGLQKPSRAAADVDQDDSELELGLDLDIKASRRADVRLDQRAAQDVIDGKSPLEAVQWQNHAHLRDVQLDKSVGLVDREGKVYRSAETPTGRNARDKVIKRGSVFQPDGKQTQADQEEWKKKSGEHDVSTLLNKLDAGEAIDQKQFMYLSVAEQSHSRDTYQVGKEVFRRERRGKGGWSWSRKSKNQTGTWKQVRTSNRTGRPTRYSTANQSGAGNLSGAPSGAGAASQTGVSLRTGATYQGGASSAKHISVLAPETPGPVNKRPLWDPHQPKGSLRRVRWYWGVDAAPAITDGNPNPRNRLSGWPRLQRPGDRQTAHNYQSIMDDLKQTK